MGRTCSGFGFRKVRVHLGQTHAPQARHPLALPLAGPPRHVACFCLGGAAVGSPAFCLRELKNNDRAQSFMALSLRLQSPVRSGSAPAKYPMSPLLWTYGNILRFRSSREARAIADLRRLPRLKRSRGVHVQQFRKAGDLSVVKKTTLPPCHQHHDQNTRNASWARSSPEEFRCEPHSSTCRTGKLVSVCACAYAFALFGVLGLLDLS